MSTYSDQALALKLTAFNLGAFGGFDGPPFPGGEFDVVPMSVTFGGSQVSTYVAATVGLATSPSDTPANTNIPDLLSPAINYGVSLFNGSDPTSDGSSTTGVLTIADVSGALDSLTTYALDGATATLLRGDPTAPLSTWSTVATFTTAGMVYDTRQKQIKARDLGWTLSGELHSTRYAGTGGYQGDSTFTNRLRPLTIGQVFDISPIQLGAALLIYEVSCSSVNAITDVRDGGASLTFDSDYPTYTALAAAAISGGHYATCLAFGLFRLGGAPAKQITADVQGDADSIGGVGYVNTRAAIAKRIAIGRGNLKLTTAQLNAASFTAFDTAQPAIVGWYWDGSTATTKAQALSQVLKGCLGWWYTGIDALLYVGVLDAPPSTGTTTITYPQDFISEPSMQAYGSPRQATYINWSTNYTPQTQDQLAGSVTQANAAIYIADARQQGVASANVLVAWPTSPIVTTDAGYALSADAATEASRQQRVLGVPRERWTITVRMDPLTTGLLGSAITVAGWPRYSFLPSRTLICVGVSVVGKNQIALDLWG